MSLIRGVFSGWPHPEPAFRPPAHEASRQFADRHGRSVGRSEVPGPGETHGIFRKAPGQKKITRERIQNVLPGTGGPGIPDDDGLPCRKRPDTVGDEAVGRPVAAADDVARPGRGETRVRTAAAGVEIGPGIRPADDLRCTFAGTYGSWPPRGSSFPVTPDPFSGFHSTCRR